MFWLLDKVGFEAYFNSGHDVFFLKEETVMSEPKSRLKNPKESFDLLEYLIIKGILMALLVLGGLGLIWHALKLLYHGL